MIGLDNPDDTPSFAIGVAIKVDVTPPRMVTCAAVGNKYKTSTLFRAPPPGPLTRGEFIAALKNY